MFVGAFRYINHCRTCLSPVQTTTYINSICVIKLIIAIFALGKEITVDSSLYQLHCSLVERHFRSEFPAIPSYEYEM